MDYGRPIDHIVYCVANLSDGIEHIASLLGVKPVIGGSHLEKGTKNALLNIGNGCYLEILAVDEKNNRITSPRWMGVDLIKEPKITRWSLKSIDLQFDSEVAQSYHSELGNVQEGSRMTPSGSTLAWQMSLPLSHPEVELFPFMTDWSNSDEHPTDALQEGCELVALQMTSPNPQKIHSYLEQLGISISIEQGKSTSISALINGKKGIVKI